MRAPSELIETWIDDIPVGCALDMGAGNGEAAIWLAQKGFKVDAVERDPEALRLSYETLMEYGIALYPVDIRDYKFPENKYCLIYASAILHFLRPTDLWLLADRMIASMAPGGYLLAEVFTTDDPGYGTMREAGATQVEPNTYTLASSEDVIHYFTPKELSRTFSSLDVLAYEETRRIDPETPGEYRSGATLVGRKKR